MVQDTRVHTRHGLLWTLEIASQRPRIAAHEIASRQTIALLTRRTEMSRCSMRGSAIPTRGKRPQVEHTRAHVRTLLRAESGCSLRVIHVLLHAELRPADRVIDYGRARAALCKRFEHRAIGHVRAAHSVETQPAHMRMVSMLAHADGMPVLDPPAVHPTWQVTYGSRESIGSRVVASTLDILLAAQRAAPLTHGNAMIWGQAWTANALPVSHGSFTVACSARS